MKEKGKGKTVAIVILILLLIGAVGYIAYDKFYVKEEATEKDIVKKEEENKQNNNDSITEDLAESYGKYLHEYARKNIFNVCSVGDLMNSVYNNGVIKEVSDNYVYQKGDETAALIYPEKIELLTSKAFDTFKNQKGIVLYGKNYYIVGDYGDCFQGMIEEDSKINVKDITADKIEYEVFEYYCKDLANHYDDCEKRNSDYIFEAKTNFEISKINGEWKISNYEDSRSQFLEENKR